MDEQIPTAPAEDTTAPTEAPVVEEATPTPTEEVATEEAPAVEEPVEAAPVDAPVIDDPRADTAQVVEEEASSPEGGVIKTEYMVQ